MSARLRLAAAALLLVAGAARARAQDVEVAAKMLGRQLPAGYYQRLRARPGAFELSRGWIARARLAAQQGAPVGGTLPVAVVPALFATSGQPPVSAAEIQKVIFDGPSQFGTISGFYEEASGGRLHVTGRVLPWVRTSIRMSDVVGDSYGLGADARTGEYLREALAAADGSVDFGTFDNDGPDGVPNSGDDDGVVDAVAFLFAEQAASCGGPAIWPHRGGISGWGGGPFVTGDRRPNGQAIVVEDYIVQSATECSGALMTPATMAHELGHVLGLPDLYDATDGIEAEHRRWVLGCWELMAAGAWGCAGNRGERPPHFSPWSKDRLGWASITSIAAGAPVRDQEFTLRAAYASNEAIRVFVSDTEYFDLEYRQTSGYDRDLPASGVLVYHALTNRRLAACPSCPRFRAHSPMLVEADGNDGLDRTQAEGGNRGEAGDVFGRAGRTTLSNVTTPSTRTFLNTPTTFTVHSVSINTTQGTARVRLSTAPTPVIAAAHVPLAAVALDSFRVALRGAGGALPYTWTAQGLPAGVTLTAAGDSITLGGKPLASGAFPVVLTLRDALGGTTTQTVTLAVTAPVIAMKRLAQPFVHNGERPLTAAEQAYLDAMGNNNGRYDVGDLRAYLTARSVGARRASY